ncbi:MAG: hypothetical protein RL095_2918 [Verrucomicrobiota bacterium]
MRRTRREDKEAAVKHRGMSPPRGEVEILSTPALEEIAILSRLKSQCRTFLELPTEIRHGTLQSLPQSPFPESEFAPLIKIAPLHDITHMPHLDPLPHATTAWCAAFTGPDEEAAALVQTALKLLKIQRPLIVEGQENIIHHQKGEKCIGISLHRLGDDFDALRHVDRRRPAALGQALQPSELAPHVLPPFVPFVPSW